VNLGIKLRPYHPQDLAQVVAMWRASKRAAFPYVAAQQSYTLEDDTAYFREVIATECKVWLAEVDGQIVGLMAMKGSLIDQLFVDVDFQGRGRAGDRLLYSAAWCYRR
jgi:hypothetical protein